MALIVMPADDLAPQTGGNNTIFPAGPWQGKIDRVESKEIPTDQAGNPFSGYTSAEGEVLSIMLGDNEPQDGQDSVKARKFFVDIPVSVGDLDLTTVNTSEFGYPDWQLQIGARRHMQLAIALGAATLTGANGDQQWAVDSDFTDQLRSGVYDDMIVGYEVNHRKTKSDKTPVVAELGTFFSAD
jgi:hypothetical protein